LGGRNEPRRHGKRQLALAKPKPRRLQSLTA
jgi:hypothetical protein